jgi:hypothetical protein
MKRNVQTRPAFAAGYSSLSRAEKIKVERVLNLLSYRPSDRPSKLSIFKSKRLPGHFIVRVTRTLRLIYQRPNPFQVVVKDLYRRALTGGRREKV